MLNKQSRTANKGWVSNLGAGGTTLPCKILACYKLSQRALDLNYILRVLAFSESFIFPYPIRKPKD
jgi:hypothetical protein